MRKIAKRLVYLLISVLILSLAACGPSGEIPETGSDQTPGTDAPGTETTQVTAAPTVTPGAPNAETDLVNTEWTLVSFGEPGEETPVIEGTNVTLQFDENGQAGGSGGCNTFSAQYDLQGSTLSFSQITHTEIACTDEGVMEQEQQFFQALQTAGDIELGDDRLTIWYGNGSSVLNFVSSENVATQTPVSDLLCSVTGLGSNPGWNLCRSPDYGFEVQYPSEGELVDQTATSARIDLPFTPGTNLTEKYLQLDVTENDPCSSPLAEGHAPGRIPTEPVQLNGLEFIKQTGQEGAAGNIYTWEAYSISRDSQCISLSFVLRSFQPELEPTPPPRYDPEEESRIFTEIISTFEWLDSPDNPTVTPTPAEEQPTPTPERIDFETGATSATVSGSLEPAGSDLYVLSVLEGQTMMVELSFTEGQAILAVWGEDGTVLMSDHAEASRFEGVLPSTQDYFIQVRGRPDGETEYEMEVTIPPLAPGEPTPTPERIDFETGATSATVSGSLEPAGSDLYVLSALEGQTMTAELSFTEGQAILAVWGEDGTVLMSDHAEASRFEGVLPSTQDYFIQVRGRPDGDTEYSLTVDIPPQ